MLIILILGVKKKMKCYHHLVKFLFPLRFYIYTIIHQLYVKSIILGGCLRIWIVYEYLIITNARKIIYVIIILIITNACGFIYVLQHMLCIFFALFLLFRYHCVFLLIFANVFLIFYIFFERYLFFSLNSILRHTREIVKLRRHIDGSEACFRLFIYHTYSYETNKLL